MAGSNSTKQAILFKEAKDVAFLAIQPLDENGEQGLKGPRHPSRSGVYTTRQWFRHRLAVDPPLGHYGDQDHRSRFDRHEP
jgi:hypothetical protein